MAPLVKLRGETHQQMSDFRVRSLVKQVTFWCYILYRRIPSWFLGLQSRQRVIVLLYHRVNDDLRDAVTVGVEQFDEQMAWLRRHNRVASIEDLVHGNIRRDMSRPVVVVTFDDGYLDNYEKAVPILLRYQIPAAFFVSTGMIGTSKGFAHDLDKLGYALPNMNCDQLRHMKELGFTIGSHTVTHLNCAKADLQEVRAELTESRDTLRHELAGEELIFATPFGRRTDMPPSVLAMVKQAGYSGCLSAYGGYVKGDIDSYDIQRCSISYNFSMLAFRARLEGLTRGH